MFEKDASSLIERVIRREEKAWEEFITRFSGLLYYSARERLRRTGILFTSQDLEDIVQGIFVELWERERLKEVRERPKINAWLSIVAQTRAINHMCAKKERLLREEELYKIDNIEAEKATVVDEGLIAELKNELKELPERDVLILKLSLIYGKTHKDIANFMKIPQNTVSTIVARKKNFLKKRLENFERKSL